MPFHGLFGGGGHNIGLHLNGGGGGHHHHYYSLASLPVFYSPTDTRNAAYSPPIPDNTVHTIATTKGEFQQQRSVPEEAENLLDVNELNQVITGTNQILKQTAPSQWILLLIAILLVMGMIFLDIFVEDPEDGFDLFLSFCFGSFIGFGVAQLPMGIYIRSSLDHRKKRFNDYLEQTNHQLFLARGCHWEAFVPYYNENCVYLFLIEDAMDPEAPHIAPPAPPQLEETIAAESTHDIEQPSAPLLNR